MKRLLTGALFTLLVCVYASASIPVQDMSPDALILEYYGILNGQNTTDEERSMLAAHMLRMHYSPASALRLTIGVGNSNFYVDNQIRNQKGLSLTAGAALFIPTTHPLISLTTGFDGYYISGSSEQMRSVGLLSVPYAGIIVHVSEFVDFELGGSYQSFDVQRKYPDNTPLSARLEDQARVYSTLTLHDPVSGVYLSGGLSCAASTSRALKDNFPNSASVWFQFGIILKQDKDAAKSDSAYW
ncbi:MAG: hypothetical protein FWE57_07450 [Chitinispirillia bacterium]|nr:hypothetical protein [Chitinispirillia bacterium]